MVDLLGIISACELLEQLTRHRVLPQLFLKELPKTKAPYVSVLFFTLFCGALYASAGAKLNVVSQMRVFLIYPACCSHSVRSPGSHLFGLLSCHYSHYRFSCSSSIEGDSSEIPKPLFRLSSPRSSYPLSPLRVTSPSTRQQLGQSYVHRRYCFLKMA